MTLLGVSLKLATHIGPLSFYLHIVVVCDPLFIICQSMNCVRDGSIMFIVHLFRKWKHDWINYLFLNLCDI